MSIIWAMHITTTFRINTFVSSIQYTCDTSIQTFEQDYTGNTQVLLRNLMIILEFKIIFWKLKIQKSLVALAHSTKFFISFLQILTKMASLRIIPTLLGFLFLFGVHVNANPVANDAPENESSWLKQWLKCFFNDASEDVGHFFLTRLINCWPTTPSM